MLYLHITISTSKNVRTPSSQLPSLSQSLRSPTRYNIVPYYGRRDNFYSCSMTSEAKHMVSLQYQYQLFVATLNVFFII